MNCSICSTELQDTDNFCPACGAKQEKKPSKEAETLVTSTQSEESKPTKSSSLWPTLIIVAVIMVVLIVIGTSNSSKQQTQVNEADSNTSETVEEAPAPPPPWYPSGYQELTSNVAYQALPVDQMNCGYSSAHSCYQIYLVSNTACTAFVDVNFLVNGVIIDKGIDSASLTAGGQALLSFVSFTAAQYDGDKKVQIIDATCY